MLIYLYSILFAAFAVIWCEVLTAPGMIFSGLDRWLHDHISREWLLNPLGDCVYCFGGQVALWGYPLIALRYEAVKYDFAAHILIVPLTIFLIHIYKKIADQCHIRQD